MQSSTTLWTQTVNFRPSGQGWHTPVSPELSKQRATDYVVRGHLKLHSETDKQQLLQAALKLPILLEAHPGSGQWWSSSCQFSSHMVKIGIISYVIDHWNITVFIVGTTIFNIKMDNVGILNSVPLFTSYRITNKSANQLYYCEDLEPSTLD